MVWISLQQNYKAYSKPVETTVQWVTTNQKQKPLFKPFQAKPINAFNMDWIWTDSGSPPQDLVW
jgi:hypothetical protein